MVPAMAGKQQIDSAMDTNPRHGNKKNSAMN